MEWLGSVMMVILTFSILWLIGECDDGDFDFFDIVTDWEEWLIGERIGCIATEHKIKWSVILISLSKMIFVDLDL